MLEVKTLSGSDKAALKNVADNHIHSLSARFDGSIERYNFLIKEAKKQIPEVAELNLKTLDGNSEFMDQVLGKIRTYSILQDAIKVIKDSPYFVRLDLKWEDSGEQQTIYISKHSYKDENIFSWAAPISTLRYAEIGNTEYVRPNGTKRRVKITRKDTYIITGGNIVFMTFNDESYPRQVVFQKHMDQRKEFLLPEIISELDKLQDNIIRSDPYGSFLISGPAGSGKTTLALHRIAYLVLTPEFEDFFVPDRIIVFVADQSAINYFGKLLPELGINGVKITTFLEWSTMITNSRFRSTSLNRRFRPLEINEAIGYISTHNPVPNIHPRIVLDEYRKLKQGMITSLSLKEGSQKEIYTKLHSWYLSGINDENPIHKAFNGYLNFQRKNRYLDEVDLTIILKSLENPIQSFNHIVVDEVQNWSAEQLSLVKSLIHNKYKSITFIGDIRQKTKAFAVNSWAEVDPEFQRDNNKSVQLLNIYRNTKEIIEYLKNKGYKIEVTENMQSGPKVLEVDQAFANINERNSYILNLLSGYTNEQIGIIAKYRSSLEGLNHLSYENPNIHVLTIEEAQGLEFDSVLLIDSKCLREDKSNFSSEVGIHSALEYAEQNRHLFYVAVTRAKKELIVSGN